MEYLNISWRRVVHTDLLFPTLINPTFHFFFLFISLLLFFCRITYLHALKWFHESHVDSGVRSALVSLLI